MQCANVRVVKLGDGTRFALESLPNVVSLMHGTREHLNGNCPVEPGVFGSVNFSHASGT
jgi:hypothetical protein